MQDQVLKVIDYLTLIAIVVGPILAVFVTRFVDHQRERSARRMDIFRTLMRTRRSPTSAEHVGALNLIEIEFARDQEVMHWWKQLFQHFGHEHPRRDNERMSEGMQQQDVAARDDTFYTRLHEERQKLLARLLHAMALELRFKAEQLEIFEGGYIPQGWVDIELEQRAIRRFAVDLYLGRRLIPIGVVDYTAANPPEMVPNLVSQAHTANQ